MLLEFGSYQALDGNLEPARYDYTGCDSDLDQHGQSLCNSMQDNPESRDRARNELELLPIRARVALSLKNRSHTQKITVSFKTT